MSRPNSVTGGATTVSAATYGPANQMLTLTSSAFSETRTYNANVQLTGLVSGGYSFQYNYSATQNNGRIQSMTDSISGETISYQYDSLNRMINAGGTGDANGTWSQAFTYDGFGNLVAKAGTNAPNNITINVNPANNQLTGNNALFDSVGNLLQYGVGTPEQYYTYDIENRVAQLTASSVVTMYGYDTRNQRVYAGPQYLEDCGGSEPSERFFFYGIDGKKLAVFTGCSGSVSVTQTNIWFAGRLLKAQDRLKSIGKYFPYGEDRTNPSPANPANGQEKFATYTRDAESGLDYAYQRYYTSGLGRFLTADRKSSSGRPTSPQSWNRYTYAGNDPTGNADWTGLDYGCDFGTWYQNGDYIGSTSVCFTGFDDEVVSVANYGNSGGAGGGGGGIASGTGGVQSTADLKLLALNALSSMYGSNCQSVLNSVGIQLSTLVNDVLHASYYNAATAPNTTMSTVFGLPAIGTIGSYVATLTAQGAIAVTIAFPTPGAVPPVSAGDAPSIDSVILTTNWANYSASWQAYTLIHEALHYQLQATDQTIWNLLGITPASYARNQDPLTAFLLNNCKNPTPVASQRSVGPL
jgi:RHS repeat-associated protein